MIWDVHLYRIIHSPAQERFEWILHRNRNSVENHVIFEQKFPTLLFNPCVNNFWKEKKKNLTAKEKDSRQKENLTENRKRLAAKRKPAHGKISSMPRGHFLNAYFFCREVKVILFAVRLFFLPRGYSFCREVIPFCREVILFAVRLFILPWGFSFCREVNSFAVTVVGHCRLSIVTDKRGDFTLVSKHCVFDICFSVVLQGITVSVSEDINL